MDIPREQRPRYRRYIYPALAVIAVVGITIAVSRLEPAAPTVDGSVWVDTVKRGLMVRQVRGPGTLVPEQMRWVAAVTAGRVERIRVQQGDELEPGTVLLELANPDVEVELLQAERQLTETRARLVELQSTLENQRLSQEAAVATVRTEYREAMRNVANNEELAERGLIPEIELARARERAEELSTRLELEERRLEVMSAALGDQLDVQREQVERLRAIVAFQRNRVASMEVTPGVGGVLSELPLQEGQWVTAGTNLARVVQPGRLKAELRIPQTQAAGVAIGQPALIDTRNDTVPGRVTRIDPAVQGGTVTVDVTLEGELPSGARPDLSVDGVIEIDRIEEALYVGRPAYGQANSTIGLFRLVDGGDAAVRVTVRLGRTSVNTVEILNGLEEGDVVILSDMSAWDSHDRVRLD